MCRLIESLKILDGQPCHLPYHQARLQQAQAALFGKAGSVVLAEVVQVPAAYCQGLVKCRVLYGKQVEQVTYSTYQRRKIQSLRLVFDNTLIYDHKYEDRRRLAYLFAQRGDCDDILIVRNGLLTDTMYGNIALYDGRRWYTPAAPLLQGTQRQRLLDQGILQTAKIYAKDIQQFSSFRVINALNEFEEQLPADTRLIF